MNEGTTLPRGPAGRALPATGVFVALLMSAGCATGIRSSPIPTKGSAPEGLVYFLPKRDITVTIVVAKDKADEVTVTAADAMPDPTKGYVATIPRNDVGTVDSTLLVNERGLLDSDSTTSVTSSLTDILSKLGSLAANPWLEVRPVRDGDDCPLPGTYRRSFAATPGSPGPGPHLCGYTVAIARAATDPATSVDNHDKPNQHGLFYRVPVAYEVKVTKDAVSRKYTVYSPTGSPTYFLPLARSTFATNTATLGFKDGVPTKYKQAIGNEAVALLSVPATVLENYFTAIGSVLTSKKGISEKEVAYLNQLNTLAVSEARRAACAKVAAESNDVEEIKKACSN